MPKVWMVYETTNGRHDLLAVFDEEDHATGWLLRNGAQPKHGKDSEGKWVTGYRLRSERGARVFLVTSSTVYGRDASRIDFKLRGLLGRVS
jgi:hypothetical protein